jgi:hypothetical protein
MSVEHIESNNPYTGIFVIKNLINDEDLKSFRNLIDKRANRTESWGESSNCRTKFLYVADLADTDDEDFITKIHQYLFVASKIINRETFVDMKGFESIKLRKVHGPTRPHCDGIVDMMQDEYKVSHIRSITIIIALNSDYEGGEICFPNHGVSLKLKAGEAIVFPPTWSHPHYTNDLNGTFRYTLSTWFNGY